MKPIKVSRTPALGRGRDAGITQEGELWHLVD
jgi:hypothetical protein